MLASCTSMTTREKRKKNVKDCTVDMINEDVPAAEAYKICKDIHKRAMNASSK